MNAHAKKEKNSSSGFKDISLEAEKLTDDAGRRTPDGRQTPDQISN